MTVVAAPELSALRAALESAILTFASASVDRQDLVERLTIVATELASNALRHARPPAAVALLRCDGSLVIGVADTDPRSSPAVDERRAFGDGGLGLVLAERLAEDVGWHPTGTGKRVWAAFSLAGR